MPGIFICRPIVLGLAACVLTPTRPGQAQEQTSQPAEASSPAAANDFPDLTIPASADVSALRDVVAKAKAARPTTANQYQAQQLALRDASYQLLKRLPKDDPSFVQTEIDAIIASVALLAFFNDDEQADVVDQVQQFLKRHKPLTIQDIQAGMLAAAMLELQPDKQPSRAIYNLLDELLADDPRDDMQSLRLNLQASVRRLNMLGNRFELDTQTIDGRSITTADFEGKMVIVDFFATWCQPCLAEAALIQSHYEKYRHKGLEVIGISLDENLDDLQRHLRDHPLPWPIIHDGADNPLDRLALKYGISALPTVLLLNKEGTVVSLEARQSELNRLMQMLFESPTPAAPRPADSDTSASDTPGGQVENPTGGASGSPAADQ